MGGGTHDGTEWWSKPWEEEYDMEICDLCGKEIPEGTGYKFMDTETGEKFWLCDDCIEKVDWN